MLSVLHACNLQIVQQTRCAFCQFCSFLIQVDALADARVLHAACGVWHTAAVAAPRPAGAADALALLGAVERRAVRQQQAAAFELLAEVPRT